MLQSDFYSCKDVYIVVKEILIVDGVANRWKYDRKLVLRDFTQFTSCISKINNTSINDAEDLDMLMPMYNLIEYSKIYSKVLGVLWNYYRDEPNDLTKQN